MTATLAPEGARASKAKKAQQVKIALSGEPSVQLLPTDVRDRAVARSRMRAGVLLVVFGIIVVVGMVALTGLRAQQAQQALADANNRTIELLSQQTQFSEAVAIDRLITQARQLQTATTETEVNWGDLIMTLVSKLPADAYIQSVSAAGALPWGDPIVQGGLPEENAQIVAVIDVEVSMVTVADATNFSRSLSSITGFHAAVMNGVAVGDDGRVASTIQVTLTREGTSGRFQPAATDADEATTDTTDTTEEQG